MCECSHNTRLAAARGAAALLQARPAPTAILAATDELALGALGQPTATAQDVSGRISLVGHDDSPAAPVAPVPLTTVRQPLGERGRQLADLVLALIARRPPPPLAPGHPELVLRSSTGPPRIAVDRRVRGVGVRRLIAGLRSGGGRWNRERARPVDVGGRAGGTARESGDVVPRSPVEEGLPPTPSGGTARGPTTAGAGGRSAGRLARESGAVRGSGRHSRPGPPPLGRGGPHPCR